MSGYIGNIPTPQATQSRQSFTATASQTTFATVGYTAGFLDVYLNGVHLLDDTDYTATNGSDIVLTTGAALNDVLEFVAYETFSLFSQTFVGTVTATSFVGSGASLTGLPAPFESTTVTGTTPSLDVGSFNFFIQGALPGDTTVTFASVPTEAKWAYKFEPGREDEWDISTASFLRSFSVAFRDEAPGGIFFKPDGTKMYVLGALGDDINEYNLSTPWNISTAVFLQVFSVFTQEAVPTGIFFKPDGSKMYVIGREFDRINEYDLSTPWNISTASHLQFFSVSTQEASPTGMFFKPDGSKMYVIGDVGDEVNEYDLSTPWNISTASHLQLFSVFSEEANPAAIFFKPDGTKMYVIGGTGDDVNEYDLSTAWDVTTASFLQLFSVATQETIPTGIFFKPDGSKMYVIGTNGDDVNEYNLGTDFTLTLPVAVQNPPTEVAPFGSQVTYDFYTTDGGTTVYLINEEVL